MISQNSATPRDDAAPSPSGCCSYDATTAAPHSNNLQNDRIVCGDCHAHFSLTTFAEYVEHKVSRILFWDFIGVFPSNCPSF